jgi:hypothetical protein
MEGQWYQLGALLLARVDDLKIKQYFAYNWPDVCTGADPGFF